MPTLYDKQFFNNLAQEALDSAREAVPLIMDLLPIRTCVDVGCGEGAWLSVFRQRGVSVLGLDGNYVQSESLLIAKELFQSTDLNKPFRLDQRFDLCMSLEVAEHLKPESGEGFVESLVCLSDCVLFSAAIPLQGGTGHINEQWPSYWAELFKKHGYVWLDPFRPALWNNPKVAWWYRQNLFLFCSEDYLVKRQDLLKYKPDWRMVVMTQETLAAQTHPRMLWKALIKSVRGKLRLP